MEVAASSDVLSRFLKVRQRTMDLIGPLETEDFVVQPAYFASPPKWHIAHTTWFFERMILMEYLDDYNVFDQDFHFLFNSYYNTLGDRTLRAERGNMTRPTVSEVINYREYVDRYMGHLLSSDLPDGLEKLVELGMNHEQQHQELFLTDLKYCFGHNPLFPVYREDHSLVSDHNTGEEGLVTIGEGVYIMGAGNDAEGFTYDNEHSRHKVYLHDFSISRRLVTNGEFIQFIEDGGYKDHRLWLDEGWAWLNENTVSKPLYWHMIDGAWQHYTLAGLKPVDAEAILAHVSYYEADAFARWAGRRLPTEAEWETAAPQLDWGNRWEWTQSAYLPYPGFTIPEGAVGEYNGKFMVNQMVLRGASNATAEGHSRISYRNFFHPFCQWQFSGIRLAK